MIDLPSSPLLSAFLIASVVLAITPGPAVFYIVTRSIAHGRQSGLTSVVGIALGNLGNAAGAAIGLAALFAVSPTAFLVVKGIGALYLVYLGAQVLRAPTSTLATAGPAPARRWRLFQEGFVVALFNPKTAFFFAAFLPQFLDTQTSPIAQSLLLGAIFVVIAAATDALYALGAGTIAPLLARSARTRVLGRYLTGASFIGLGLFAVLSGLHGDTA